MLKKELIVFILNALNSNNIVEWKIFINSIFKKIQLVIKGLAQFISALGKLRLVTMFVAKFKKCLQYSFQIPLLTQEKNNAHGYEMY